MTDTAQSNGIGLLNEKPLHAALKEWYARPGDRFEVPLEGYVIDIVRAGLLIEIQTANFSAIGRKLRALLENHAVRLVYPIAQEKWLLKVATRETQRRKSPKRGRVGELFRELVRIPELLARPEFAIEVLLIREEEVRRHDPSRAWRRRGWVTEERRLLGVLSQRRFETPADLWALTGDDLPQTFTTADLAKALGEPRWLAQKAAYCYRKMGLIHRVGTRSRSALYVLDDGEN
jgi:hypothetical protein